MTTATSTQLSPLVVSSREAARLLGISQRTLWEITKSGEVKSLIVGRRALRYVVAELERYVAERHNASP